MSVNDSTREAHQCQDLCFLEYPISGELFVCGFACLWQHDDPTLAKRMIEKIEHRGPDETQVYRSPNVPAIMAHCRLSIIGPSDGSQPIYSADNILVANGEIYNYSDLRAILGESAFETRSDSETILHLFRSNQLRWVTKLDGMFAFVLATPERIIAARDPLGIKPLYVAQLDEGLAFCSELKAFDGLGLSKIEAIGPGEMFDSLDGTRRWFRIPQPARCRAGVLPASRRQAGEREPAPAAGRSGDRARTAGRRARRTPVGGSTDVLLLSVRGSFRQGCGGGFPQLRAAMTLSMRLITVGSPGAPARASSARSISSVA